MKTQTLSAVTFLFFLFLFTGCTKETTTVGPTYSINGFVKSPNLSKAVGNAHVYADNKSSGYETSTDAQGQFKLKLPLGAHTIYVETGNGALFKNSFHVTSSTANEEVVIPVQQSILVQRGQMAYVAGMYDQIETVVRDTLGFTIHQIQTADLNDAALLSQYGAIFINCGAIPLSGTPSDSGYTNLGNFVAHGGSLYASDFGLDYLLGVYDGTCAPGGGFIDDSKICVSRTGPITTLAGCQVNDLGLQTALGTTTVDIAYNLDGWYVVNQWDNTFWKKDIADASGKPLLLHSDQYTNSSGTTPGKIYFTTFHNEYNSTISNTSETILEYVILHL